MIVPSMLGHGTVLIYLLSVILVIGPRVMETTLTLHNLKLNVNVHSFHLAIMGTITLALNPLVIRLT